MKPKATLRHFLVLAGSSLLAISSTHAQTLYFDGSNTTTANGVSNYGSNTSGTPHIWDTTTANWDNGSEYVEWINGRDANLRTSTGSNKYIKLDNSVTVGALAWPTSGGTAFLQTSNSSSLTVNGGIDFGSPAGVRLEVPVILGGSQIWSMGGTNSTLKVISGGTNLNGHTLTWNSTGTGTNANSYPQHSTITGSGNLIKDGAGFLRLQGTNDYTGTTTVSAGTIMAESSTALGNANNQLTINTGGTLNMGSQSLSIGNLTGTGGVITSTHTSGTRTLTIGSGDNGGGNFQGVIENGTTGSTTALTKTGTGTITLSGTNTYTGDTNVSAGSLIINGATSSTSTVTVETNGTLGGGGTIGGTLAVTGKLSPGDGITPADTLTLGSSLTLNANSILAFGLGTDSDLISFSSVADNLIGSGNATLQLSLLSGFSYANTYTIFQNTSTSAFTLLDITGYDDANYTANFFDGGDSYLLNFTPVPEPRAALLGGLGLLALLRRRR